MVRVHKQTLEDKATMAASMLDLMVLTFNCAKTLINVPVFARHLQDAFGKNASGLPDVIVLSLQEIAPLSYCFIGGYFLNPYLARFEEAVNLAATHYADALRDDVTRLAAPPVKPYSVVRAKNVGYTGIVLLARDPARLRNVQEAEVGFGAADMGNKGAAGLRVVYEGRGKGEETELTFVATHLAAMEWNLPRRNANWAAIVRGMAFENPEAVVESFRKAHALSASQDPSDDDSEHMALLHSAHETQGKQLQQALHDISVFKPSSHLFVAGDLNYRISTTAPPPNARFPSLDPASPNYYPDFFQLDQLTRARNAGRTLHGLSEHEVRFPPTYKYDVLPAVADPEVEVPWQFAEHRWPSWTDRILYLDLPPWVTSSPPLKVHAYDALPVLRTSDHRPVFLRISVPLIPPSVLSPPPALAESETSTDPRVRLPVEMDPEAWERRAAARRKEVMAGWSMILWSTKEGACVLATALAVGLATYWLCRGWTI